MKKELKAKGVELAKMDGSEVARVRALGGGRAEGQGDQASMSFMEGSMGLFSLGIQLSRAFRLVYSVRV